MAGTLATVVGGDDGADGWDWIGAGAAADGEGRWAAATGLVARSPVVVVVVAGAAALGRVELAGGTEDLVVVELIGEAARPRDGAELPPASATPP